MGGAREQARDARASEDTGTDVARSARGGRASARVHVAVRAVVIWEAVDGFDAGKQDERKKVLGDHLGLLASDLEGIRMSETTLD